MPQWDTALILSLMTDTLTLMYLLQSRNIVHEEETQALRHTI